MKGPEDWDPAMLEEYLAAQVVEVGSDQVRDVRQRVIDRNRIVVGLDQRGTRIDLRSTP